MTFRIAFSPTAEVEILAAADYIAQTSPLNAERWFDSIHQAIMSLARMPNRCALARESDAFDMDVRQLVCKSYRVIFTVEGNVVRIHRVIHTARRSLASPNDLSPDA